MAALASAAPPSSGPNAFAASISADSFLAPSTSSLGVLSSGAAASAAFSASSSFYFFLSAAGSSFGVSSDNSALANSVTDGLSGSVYGAGLTAGITFGASGVAAAAAASAAAFARSLFDSSTPRLKKVISLTGLRYTNALMACKFIPSVAETNRATTSAEVLILILLL